MKPNFVYILHLRYHCLIIAWLTCFISWSSSAQQLVSYCKRYTSGSNFVQLCGDTAEFLVTEGCCLLSDVYGKGSFRKSDNEIQISVGEAPDARKPGHKIIRNLPDTRELQLQIATNGRGVEDIIIRLVDIGGKSVFATQTDSSGYASVPAPQEPAASALRLEISKFGFDTYTIPFEGLAGKTVKVELQPYRLLKAQKVFFKVDCTGSYLQGPFLTSSQVKHMSRTVRLIRKWQATSKRKMQRHCHEPSVFYLRN